MARARTCRRPGVRTVARLSALLLSAFVLLSVRSVHATTIAIARPPNPSPQIAEALFRLQGELLALGLDVQLARRPRAGPEGTSDSRALLAELAAERRVDALIEVVGVTEPTAVEIWIVRASGDARVSRVELAEPGENTAETLAIRAIEVLRSNFLEIDLAARRRSGLPAVAPAPAEPRRDDGPRAAKVADAPLGLELGAAVLTSVDGVGPAFMPLVRADWALGARVAAQATFAGFGTRPTLQTELGSARVAQQFALLGACHCSPSDAGLRPALGIAAGALHTSLEGRAVSPERGHTVARWSFLLEASLGVRLRLPAGYDLTLASHVQWAEPYVVVHFVDSEVGSSGRPNLLLSLTIGRWL